MISARRAVASRLERLTVKPHVSSTLAKLWLGLRDRTQVVVFAYEGGLVAAGEHDIGH